MVSPDVDDPLISSSDKWWLVFRYFMVSLPANMEVEYDRGVICSRGNNKIHDTLIRRTSKPLVRALVAILRLPSEVRSSSTPPLRSSGMGYSRGGTQVREATSRWQSNCWAVGRAEGDSPQHFRTNRHSGSERPRSSALSGFLGRPPFCTVITTA